MWKKLPVIRNTYIVLRFQWSKSVQKKCIVYWAPMRNKNNDSVGIYKQKTGGNVTEPMKGKTVRSTSLFLLYRGQSVQETVHCTENNKGNNKQIISTVIYFRGTNQFNRAFA